MILRAATESRGSSDGTREQLRLLEEREAGLTALRRAIYEGLDSGAAEPFDIEQFVAEKSREPKRA